MRVLLCQGGGLKGAKQVRCAKGLLDRHKYGLIMGTSTGSLTGVCAAMGKLGVLEGIYNHIDDPQAWNGVSGILNVDLQEGYYNTKPLAEKLEKHVSLSDFKTDFACGVVTRRPLKHYLIRSWDPDMTNTRLRIGVRASCSVGGAMDYQEMMFGGDVFQVSDGGHLHTIPPPPKKHKGEPVTEIDVIMCNPASLVAEVGKKGDGPDTIFSSFVWVLEAALAQTQIHDLENLRYIARNGVKVRIFAPEYQVGGLVEASRAVIQEQLALGEYMLETPIDARDLR